MATSHRFTIRTTTAKELYEHNYSKYLCGIHNACYPFKETALGTTHLWATTPEKLAGFLLEDQVNFSYESYDVEENNTLLEGYEERGQEIRILQTSLTLLKAKYTKRNDEIEALRAHLADMQTDLAKITHKYERCSLMNEALTA